MTKYRKAALLALGAAMLLIGLQVRFDIQTGLAGLFVAGMAGGLLIGGEMARDTKGTEEQAGE